MSFDFAQDYFTFFGLPQRFALAAAQLETAYRVMQTRVHPDRYAQRNDAEKRLAMQWSAYANEAYRTLKHPVDRAGYLIRLVHADFGDKEPRPECLMQYLDYRETMQHAAAVRDAAALDRIDAALRRDRDARLRNLAVTLDEAQDYTVAAHLVTELRFLDKLARDIATAREDLEPR